MMPQKNFMKASQYFFCKFLEARQRSVKKLDESFFFYEPISSQCHISIALENIPYKHSNVEYTWSVCRVRKLEFIRRFQGVLCYMQFEIDTSKSIFFLSLWQVYTYLHCLSKDSVEIKVLKSSFKNSTEVVGAIESYYNPPA